MAAGSLFVSFHYVCQGMWFLPGHSSGCIHIPGFPSGDACQLVILFHLAFEIRLRHPHGRSLTPQAGEGRLKFFPGRVRLLLSAGAVSRFVSPTGKQVPAGGDCDVQEPGFA